MHIALVCLGQETPAGFTLYWTAVSQSISGPHYMSFCYIIGIQTLAISDNLSFADNYLEQLLVSRPHQIVWTWEDYSRLQWNLFSSASRKSIISSNHATKTVLSCNYLPYFPYFDAHSWTMYIVQYTPLLSYSDVPWIQIMEKKTP